MTVIIDNKELILDEDEAWRLTTHVYHIRPDGYAARNSSHILLHREINNTPEGFHTDHKNGNTLNNLKSNLRTATNSENQHNSKLRLDNSSGIKGVSWDWRKQKWYATIQVNGLKLNLGRYSNKWDAKVAYQCAALDFYEDFVRKV